MSDRLTTAAPELLAALREMVPGNIGAMTGLPDDAIIPVDMTAGEIRRARAAIAKATTPETAQ